MNKAPFSTFIRSCPGCGAALNAGSVTCQSCGGIVAVENILGKLKAEVKYQISSIGGQLKDRGVLLWVLALCPILILPPLLAIFMSFRTPTQMESDERISVHPDYLIVIAAACNVILSLMFWRWLGEMSMGISFIPFFKTIGIVRPSGTAI